MEKNKLESMTENISQFLNHQKTSTIKSYPEWYIGIDIFTDLDILNNSFPTTFKD